MMKLFFILPLIAAALFSSGCSHRSEKMDQRLDAIQADIEILKEKNSPPPSRRDALRKIPRNKLTPENQQEYLEIIAVPISPDMADLARFIDDTNDLNFLRDRKLIRPWIDSQVQTLGRNYLPYLLPFCRHGMLRSAVFTILLPEDKQMLWEKSYIYPQLLNGYIKLVDASDAEFVLKMLPVREDLIAAVIKLQLTEKAMPVVVERLQRGDYFQSYNQWLRVALDNTEGNEWEEIIETAFQVMRHCNLNASAAIAETLSRQGFQPAYDYLVKYTALDKSLHNPWRPKIQALSPCKNINEFNAWYQKNRNNLVFDLEKKIFREVPVRSR